MKKSIENKNVYNKALSYLKRFISSRSWKTDDLEMYTRLPLDMDKFYGISPDILDTTVILDKTGIYETGGKIYLGGHYHAEIRIGCRNRVNRYYTKEMKSRDDVSTKLIVCKVTDSINMRIHSKVAERIASEQLYLEFMDIVDEKVSMNDVRDRARWCGLHNDIENVIRDVEREKIPITLKPEVLKTIKDRKFIPFITHDLNRHEIIYSQGGNSNTRDP